MKDPGKQKKVLLRYAWECRALSLMYDVAQLQVELGIWWWLWYMDMIRRGVAAQAFSPSPNKNKT